MLLRAALAAALAGLLLCACGGGGGGFVPGPTPTVTAPPGSAMNLYVANAPSLLGPEAGTIPSVAVFPLTANGNVAPSRVVAGANTGLAPGSVPNGLTFDAAGRLYVAAGNDAGDAPPGITVYPAAPSGNVAPLTTVTQTEPLQGIALAGGRMYTLSLATLLGFPVPGSTLPPTTVTVGPPFPDGIAADSFGYLYILDEAGDVSVYAPGATAASRKLTAGIDTGVMDAIAVDSGANVYVGSDGLVQVFAKGVAGNATPTRSISGPNTSLSAIVALAVDSAGNLYVADQVLNGIVVFGPTANGNVAPLRTIVGSATGLYLPNALAIGP